MTRCRLPSRRFVNLSRQHRLLRPKRVRLALLVAGCVLIPAWQFGFFRSGRRLDGMHRLRSASGLHNEAKFVYFYYYLGLYPATTDEKELVYSREGAERLLAERGESLLMEWGHTIRYGDLGKMFLYLPYAFLKGSPEHPSVRPCHALFFTFALVALFASFWWVRHTVFGLLTVFFLGSHPFQLCEVYAHENVFGWPISTAVLVLAMHLPLLGMRKPPRWYVWAVPVLTGALLATIRQVRTEPVMVIIPAGLSYLVIAGARWRTRLALVGILALGFVLGSRAWESYFDYKFEQARQAVEAAGGHPYSAPRDLHHMRWHPIWIGLGDFDRKYGYAWDDRIAAAYAFPILRDRYGVKLPKWDGRSYVCDEYWDEAKKYYKTPYELPHYAEVIRDKVIHDITHDPVWYLGILLRRAWRVATQTPPVRLALGRWHLTLPMHGLLFLPLVTLLAIGRSWMLLKTCCFTLSLALPALVVYSGRGMCYYSCHHVLAAALLGAWALEGVLWWMEKRGVGKRSKPSAPPVARP
jgi:hypothetical protein